MPDLTGEATELLQHLIRNRCVNEGVPESGHEDRNAATLTDYLGAVDMQRFEPLPGRASLVARIEGSDPTAPGLMLMGHTDVVPANPNGWERDPFGGELVDGEVWGRGAVDMLNVTSTMAVAFRSLAASGFKPRGDLIYFAVADEEALGTHGADHMTQHERDAVRADYVITEFGGMRFPLPGAPKMPVMVGEKGTYWCKLRVRGTPGHASLPFGSDNAVVKMAEVVRRLDAYQPQTRVIDIWRRFVDALDLPAEMAEPMRDPARIDGFVTAAGGGLAKLMHSCTHTTIAQTILHGGVKTNIIPDTAELQLDIRTLPDVTGEQVRAMLDEALGDMAGEVEVVDAAESRGTESPVDTPLWDVLQDATASLVPGARTVPMLMVAATDARFFRRIGATAYGYGLLSERIPFDQFSTMFHGDNERVDVESLGLCTELWLRTAQAFLS
jgi:acetylornithine deacetylase/succinyl-diaminopimelate desuccinylase-like protein